MLHPELVVARTGVDSTLPFWFARRIFMLLPHCPHLSSPREYAVVSPCVGTLTAFHLARDKLERLAVDNRLVHILDGYPVLRLFRSYPADLEFVLGFL